MRKLVVNARQRITLAFAAVVVVAVTMLSVLGWVVVETRDLARKNAGLIAKTDELREQRTEDAARADHRLCEAINSLRWQNRQKARQSYRESGQTLRLLRIEETPEIRRLILRNLRRDLRRNKHAPCTALPSQRPFVPADT